MGSSERFAQASLLALVLALAGCGSSQSRFESHMDRGRQYLAAGNLEKASIEFRNALQIDPRSGAAYYLNGRVAERLGNISEAVDSYAAAIDVEPGYDRARASLAKAFVLGGATQRALEVVSPGLLDHPDNPDLLAARAAARHQLGDDAEAQADAERAARLEPSNENAIAVLAALALRSNDTARAISLVDDAVKKAPRSVDLRRILASIYLSTQQPEKAEEQMRAIIALEPGEMTPRLQLAEQFAQAGKLDSAQGVLEDAVRDMPNRDGAKLALVEFVSTQRSREQGERILRKFLADEPGDEDLRLALGMLLQRAGATQQASAIYQEVVRREGLGPKGLAARDRIAAIELAAGHDAAAMKLVSEVLDESARDDDALIMRANIAMQRNDPTNAIIDFRAVLRNQPKSSVLQRSLARAYIAKGQPALAEEALRSAVEAVPGDASIRIDLAQVFVQTDRPSLAVALLEETVHLAPDDLQVRESLVRAYMANRDLPAARRAVEDLQRLHPQEPDAYYLAGLIAHDEKRFDESEKSLVRALELRPGSLDILTSLTRFSLERGRAVVAIERLQHALEGDPKNVQIMVLLGGTYLEIKDLPHAMEVLTRAKALAPRSWIAYRDLAQVRLAADDPDGAIEEYQAALELEPAQPRLVTELATLYEKRGRIDDAIARYGPLLKGDADSQQIAANNVAMLLVTYKNDRASLDRARSLTARFDLSNNPSLLDTTGWVHFKRGEYKDAVTLLERAADRSPDSQVIRHHLNQARSALASLKAPRSG
jgi:tetratricopeptide (TPR) repeat protein